MIVFGDGQWLMTQGQFAIPLATADAWFYQYLAYVHKPPQWERRQLTMGSVEYYVMPGADVTWRFTFLPLSARSTFWVVGTTKDRPSLDAAHTLISTFVQWHTSLTGVEQEDGSARIRAVTDKIDVSQSPTTARRRSTATIHNDWAREQMTAGADRETVYREWLKRRKLDISTQELERLARDTFRKAIARRRSDGRGH